MTPLICSYPTVDTVVSTLYDFSDLNPNGIELGVGGVACKFIHYF